MTITETFKTAKRALTSGKVGVALLGVVALTTITAGCTTTTTSSSGSSGSSSDATSGSGGPFGAFVVSNYDYSNISLSLGVKTDNWFGKFLKPSFGEATLNEKTGVVTNRIPYKPAKVYCVLFFPCPGIRPPVPSGITQIIPRDFALEPAPNTELVSFNTDGGNLYTTGLLRTPTGSRYVLPRARSSEGYFPDAEYNGHLQNDCPEKATAAYNVKLLLNNSQGSRFAVACVYLPDPKRVTPPSEFSNRGLQTLGQQ